MRSFRAQQVIRDRPPFVQCAPDSIFHTKRLTHPRDPDTAHYALKLANQLNYGNSGYSYDGKPAPSFYGYTGTGWSGTAYGFSNYCNFGSYTVNVWFVPPGIERVKFWWLHGKSTPEPESAASYLQVPYNSVPLPDLSKVPYGEKKLWGGGTDRRVCIIDPQTDEMWEMFAPKAPGEGPNPELYPWSINFGNYVKRLSKYKGIPYLPPDKYAWGCRASRISCPGGVITHQDLIDVLRGGKIQHALGVAIAHPKEITSAAPTAAFRAPAISYDTTRNGYLFEQDGIKPNGAYGTVDQVPEGAWFCFPPESRASDYPALAGPLAKAVYEAIREYGCFVHDGSGGNCAWELEGPQALGSPYSYAKINPFAGNSEYSGVNTACGSAWTDPTLPVFTEKLGGTSNFLVKQPWQTLEMLEAFSGSPTTFP